MALFLSKMMVQVYGLGFKKSVALGCGAATFFRRHLPRDMKKRQPIASTAVDFLNIFSWDAEPRGYFFRS
jgi:hypothetical protein